MNHSALLQHRLLLLIGFDGHLMPRTINRIQQWHKHWVSHEHEHDMRQTLRAIVVEHIQCRPLTRQIKNAHSNWLPHTQICINSLLLCVCVCWCNKFPLHWASKRKKKKKKFLEQSKLWQQQQGREGEEAVSWWHIYGMRQKERERLACKRIGQVCSK